MNVCASGELQRGARRSQAFPAHGTGGGGGDGGEGEGEGGRNGEGEGQRGGVPEAAGPSGRLSRSQMANLVGGFSAQQVSA